MSSPSSFSSLGPLIGDVVRTILVGKPSLPDRRSVPSIPPHLKLSFLIACWAQLGVFVASALGGIGLWIFVQLNDGNNPLTDTDPLVTSLILETWWVFGSVLGISILVMSRLWAVPPGVEWGWMCIRLAGLVIVLLFVLHTASPLERDESFSLITSLILVLSSYFFLKKGWKTIDEVMHISSDISASRSKLFVKGENLIFVSYRRGDSRSWTDSIARSLKDQFGEKVVFQDTMAIHPGEDFPERIRIPLQDCVVLLAVIGPDWVSAKDEHGNRRLDDQKDWVRFEIKSVLQREIPLIPLLVDGAKMASEKELPESISKLASKNSMPIRANPDFDNDMNRLFEALMQYVK